MLSFNDGFNRISLLDGGIILTDIDFESAYQIKIERDGYVTKTVLYSGELLNSLQTIKLTKKYLTMRNKSFKLNINEPCHEDWGKMTPNEQGRFCDSCAKSVVDFSNSTDIEIIQFLETHKGQKTCGRFKATQLERPIHHPYAEQSYSNFSLRAAVLGATLTSLLSLESCKEPVRMGDVAAVHTTEQPANCIKPSEYEYTKGEVAVQEYDHSQEKLMSGIIMDGAGNKIEKAKLTIFNEGGVEIGKTTAKTDGSFRLELNWEKKPSYVQITSDDYLMLTIRLNRTEVLQEMKVVLNEAVMIKGDIDVREE